MRDIQRRFRFFLAHGGYIVGEHARCALELARAERWANDNGCTYTWEPDDPADLMDHEYWCNDARREKAGYWPDGQPHRYGLHSRLAHTHDVEGCVMRDASGIVLASLWGIIDASPQYRRVVEAELAAEVVPEHPRLWEGFRALVGGF